MERLRALPGVRGATVSMPTLLSGGTNSTGMFVQGRVPPTAALTRNQITINRVVIAPNFFETMGISLVAGRKCHRTRSCEGAESRRHQPGGGAKVFPEREPARSPVRELGGNVGRHRDRRRASRRALQQSSSGASTNDVCPIRAAWAGWVDFQRADSRRPVPRLCRPYVAR